MTLKDRLVRIRRILGISQRELADRIGVRLTMIAAIESGHDCRFLPDIARALDGLDPVAPAADIPAPALVLARKTPVFAATVLVDGTILLGEGPMGFLVRPEPLADADAGYGVLIGTTLLAPALRIGEIALARPGVMPRPDDLCIFRGEGRRAVLAEFRSREAERWWVKRSPADETVHALPRADWAACDVVVGKHLGR